MTQHFYLSPHLDDAVFSCGGLIARQVRAGEAVTVLTICAGNPPPGELSAFAEELHARWGWERSPIEVRRAEDLAACEHLCAGVIHLEIPDAVYRQGPRGAALYPDEKAIFGAVHECEPDLIVRLAKKLARLLPNEALIYSPLACGGHVDHRLTRLAAERSRRNLYYYYELPYAAQGDPIPEDLGLPAGEERTFSLGVDEIEAWLDASACYQSQISTFWDDEAALREQFSSHSERQKGLVLRVSLA